MDPSHDDGQSLSPSFAKHAEKYHEGPEVLFMVYSPVFVKRKKEKKTKYLKQLTGLEIPERYIFS